MCWCSLKLTNWLHCGKQEKKKKNYKSESPGGHCIVFYLARCWNPVWCWRETEGEKKKTDPLSSKAHRKMHFNWNGRPARSLWKSKPPMEASKRNVMWRPDSPSKKNTTFEQWVCRLRTGHLVNQTSGSNCGAYVQYDVWCFDIRW